MLLKKNVEKMSVGGYATMSMKIKGLFYNSHDVYEKKVIWLKPEVENGDGPGRRRPPLFYPSGRCIGPVEV